MLKEGAIHLNFVCSLYRRQVKHGTYYLHEHPLYAASWQEPEVQRMMRDEITLLAKMGQCQYGLWVEDGAGWAASKKPTKFMTNSPAIAGLQRKCPGRETHIQEGVTRTFTQGSQSKPRYIPMDYATQYAKD